MSETSATRVLEQISESISNLDPPDEIRRMVEMALAYGYGPIEITEKAFRKGLEEVGNRYEKGEYFLSELLYAGETMKSLFDMLGTHIGQGEIAQKGMILLGTVRGDIHDIGKNIFGMLAQFSGFKVHDLGVDVDPKTFIGNVDTSSGGILGMSSLLTTTLPEVKVVLDELRLIGIRDRVKVIIGGNAVTKQFAEEVDADAAAFDAVEGVGICKRWVTSSEP